jgi:hypothetical protein
VSTRAIATFEVTAWEETVYAEPADGPKLARVTVNKTFQGDIIGESSAELLMSQGQNGYAGYVALERVTGSVAGRSGSFDVQHCATQGGPSAKAFWLVVPGSGTGELRGLIGDVTYRHDESGAIFTLDYDFESVASS